MKIRISGSRVPVVFGAGQLDKLGEHIAAMGFAEFLRDPWRQVMDCNALRPTARASPARLVGSSR